MEHKLNEFEQGDVVVARYDWNDVTKRPFEFLYEFGYYSAVEGKCVVYNHGERNMQDSHAFDVAEIRLASEEDKGKFYWGD